MLYFLKNGASFFQRRQENVLSAAFVIAVAVAFSRILGLIRYRLLAADFGDDIGDPQPDELPVRIGEQNIPLIKEPQAPAWMRIRFIFWISGYC